MLTSPFVKVLWTGVINSGEDTFNTLFKCEVLVGATGKNNIH